MKRMYCFILVLLGFQFQFHAESLITIHNKTKEVVFARIYCVPIFELIKVEGGELYELWPDESKEVRRPEKNIACTRHLAFSLSKNQLAEELAKKEFEQLPSIGIGLTTGNRIFDNFYVTQEKGKLKGYNTLTWQPQQLLYDYEQSLLNSALVKNNPYKDKVARLRVGADISPDEKNYVRMIEPKVKSALEKFLGRKLNGSFIPKIAFINSGGGARAFISCLGWHVGAQEIGLLDAITYDIGLSGGSWFISCWLLSGQQPAEFKKAVQPLLNKELYPSGTRFSPGELKEFIDSIMVRNVLEQPVTIVNLWGSLLANRYLAPYGSQRQEMLFSTLSQKLQGKWPFPILTAASGHTSDLTAHRHSMDWFEMTPFEVGAVGDWLGHAHIPTWGFGRAYKKDVSIDNKPQYDVGLIMGICGSAFAMTYARTYAETIQAAIASIPIFGTTADKVADVLIERLVPENIQDLASSKRLTVAKVPNFAKDLVGSTIKDDTLRLVDAGIAFNLPIPSALKRKVDMLILLDASESFKMASELQIAERYIRAHGYKFPPLTFNDIEKKPATLFEDADDQQSPVVIYMPNTDPTGKLNSSFDVMKFNYSPVEFGMLSGVTESNMKVSQDIIKKALIDLIERHNGFE